MKALPTVPAVPPVQVKITSPTRSAVLSARTKTGLELAMQENAGVWATAIGLAARKPRKTRDWATLKPI